jgi:hypothetical protein
VADIVKFLWARLLPSVQNTAQIVLLAGTLACMRSPIAWEDAAYFDPTSPDDRELCAAETDNGAMRFRAHWDPVNQTVGVMRSANRGATWEGPVVVEARKSAAGLCPLPAIFADTANRYLHVSYFLDARGGTGLFYAHSMAADKLAASGEGMFEPPRAVVFGERPVRSAIASRGDTVAVVHEDPNSRRGRIVLALSTTGGHSFSHRESVSATAGDARQPGVALRAGEIHVVWVEESRDTVRGVRRIGRFR